MQICCHSKLVITGISRRLFSGIWNNDIEIKIEENVRFSKSEVNKGAIRVLSIGKHYNKKAKKKNGNLSKVEKDSDIVLGLILFILIRKQLLINL